MPEATGERRSKLYETLSLFTGGMGLDLGLEEAGFDIRACVEMNDSACRTISLNRPNVALIEGDISLMSPDDVLSRCGLEDRDVFLIAGGPPCQAFSTAGKRASFGDPRGSLFAEFVRFIERIQPKYFLMENVRGLLSAAIEHRPLAQRGADSEPLKPDEQLGSALKVILGEFERIGYGVNYRLLNAADYGVPQTRERVIFIGSRDGSEVSFLPSTHSKGGLGGLPKWRTLGDALEGFVDEEPQYPAYSEARAEIFRRVPAGGNWRSLPKDLQESALGGAYNSTGGRVGFFRRLTFDKPSPTIITSVSQKASGMCHPVETRPLSVAECKRIQQFPDNFEFVGSMAQKYTQIGNAVPAGLAKSVGDAIMEHDSGGAEYDKSPEHSLVAAKQLELSIEGL